MKRVFHIYTDGSCKVHSSKAGSWGYIIIDALEDEPLIEGSGAIDPKDTAESKTTSPMMELIAVLHGVSSALNNLPDGVVTLYSDSEVVVKGINEWIHNWKKRDWKKSNFKPVINKKLWQQLDQLTDMIDVTFEWVPGHAGIYWNEHAHYLAEKALSKWENLNNQ